MSEKKIRGGSLIARALKDKGIQHVFTLSGGFCNPALEGFMECQMEVINCPHEQVAGHIADGHTRITRKPGSMPCWSRGVCKCCSINDGSLGVKDHQ
jgi:acetolactate synthase-1/2/3 large subunit